MTDLFHTCRRFKVDYLVLALMLGSYAFVACERLATVPVPETDEAYMLHVSYEMLNNGRLAMPFRRFLGGHIETNWHSLTPLYYVLLAGFMKLTGWGVLQGRIFNLVTAILLMIVTYVIAKRMFDWRVGMLAILFLMSDSVFFEHARLLRNDYIAAFAAMLAYLLYEIAEERKKSKWFIATGLVAGACVMLHSNGLYMLGAIPLMMLLTRGWIVVKSKSLYQYLLSALAVMAYEIVTDLLDYKNFLLQYRGDKLHFGVLSLQGWWGNISNEPSRYLRWYAGGALFPNIPRTTLHIFQALACVALIYLIVVGARAARRGGAMREPRVRILVVTGCLILFQAIVAGHKEAYYIAHLAPWYALCAGILLTDVLDFLWSIRMKPWAQAATISNFAIVLLLIAGVLFGLQLARQTRRYLREAHNPELASFEEIKGVLRSTVPEGVCPVVIKFPVMYLVFPEKIDCFANIEDRMMENVDLDGKEYVVLLPNAAHAKRAQKADELEAKYPLIAELKDTAYGDIAVYYTGQNEAIRSRPAAQYRFFKSLRGHAQVE
jgi:4-amino-4-deoxy-L-arabinose transferase-like glycosyltransferase